MNRPQRVREVYAELKEIMGNTMSPADLLECAWLIVRSADGYDIRPRYDLRTGTTPFEELPLDVLFDKWSWRLVCRDYQPEEPYTPHERPEDLLDQLFRFAA